ADRPIRPDPPRRDRFGWYPPLPAGEPCPHRETPSRGPPSDLAARTKAIPMTTVSSDRSAALASPEPAADHTSTAQSERTDPGPEIPATEVPMGQWRGDGRVPLNPTDGNKAADNGQNRRPPIVDTYAKEGFASIPSDDLNGRFRWMGLYTQRKQGIDGARTSKLEADELSDEYFMMRVRIDGGGLTTDQLRVVAGISTEFARDTADVTDRQNIQLHWVAIEDVPEIWRRLDAVGLHTTEACGDVPRVILGSPVAGIAADEIVDPTPVIREISQRYIGNPELS